MLMMPVPPLMACRLVSADALLGVAPMALHAIKASAVMLGTGSCG